MGDQTRKAIDLLFSRPLEPAFIPKGNENASFDVPKEYLIESYQPLQNDLANRFGGDEKIPVKKITIPDLSIPLQLGRRDTFSLFVPHHHKIAAKMINIFMAMRTVDDFISLSVYCRDRLNPYLFIYCVSVAILHRPDTKNIPIPSLNEVFPDKFVDGALFDQAKEASNIVPVGQRQPIIIPMDYTGTDRDEEHRIAYFREDIGINLHHWHWHLVYPFDGTREIVAKDRRGELFYYMHQQIIARYNFERLCNRLGRVKRLLNLREPIPEGYFPKLDSLVASRVWPPRFANVILRDIDREADQIKFDIDDLVRWRDRIYSAVHTGNIINERGEPEQLTEAEGIDKLGNMLEASLLSPNRNLYGDLHNLGHVAIALSHDPDNRHLETFQVMGDPATAMRDPIFYRWHAFIDDLFHEHKNTLPRYTTQQLTFAGVRVSGLEVVTTGSPQKNQFETYWRQDDVDLSRGLDFTPRGAILARYTHLQHSPYTINIQVQSAKPGNAMVRVFISPRFDERGAPFLMRDQRKLFVEIDKFVAPLTGGKQVISRKSVDSNVTIPYERTFRNLDSNRPAEGSSNLSEFNFCGCGWPHHMLIPKGAPGGFEADLFVMISNYDEDKVDNDDLSKKRCADAASYCGVRDSKYPDKKPMGYPFDRPPRTGADTLKDFLTPNMGTQPVTINFTNRTEAPPQRRA